MKLIKVSKQFKRNKILTNISYEFPSTGLVFLIGKSGSGKSTLLSIMYKALKPTRGKVVNLEKTSIVFQNFYLIDFFTVGENLELPLLIDGISNNEAKKIVNNMLIEFSLTYLKNQYPCKLSQGEKGRIAMLKAIINNPKIILMDEPTGCLDEINRKFVLDYIKKISLSTLVVVVTHNQKDAQQYGDVILKLENGKLNCNQKNIVDNTNKIKKNKKHINTSLIKSINNKYLLTHKIQFLVSVISIIISLSLTLIFVSLNFLSTPVTDELSSKYVDYDTYLISEKKEITNKETNLTFYKYTYPSLKSIAKLDELNIHYYKDRFSLFPLFTSVKYNNKIFKNIQFRPIISEDSFFKVKVNKELCVTYLDGCKTKSILLNKEFIVESHVAERKIYDLLKLNINFTIDTIEEENNINSHPSIYYSVIGLERYLNTIVLSQLSSVNNKITTLKERLDHFSYKGDVFMPNYLIAQKKHATIFPSNLYVENQTTEAKQFFNTFLKTIDIITSFYTIITIFDCSFLFYILQKEMIENRRKEFATLLTSGAEKTFIKRMIDNHAYNQYFYVNIISMFFFQLGSVITRSLLKTKLQINIPLFDLKNNLIILSFMGVLSFLIIWLSNYFSSSQYFKEDCLDVLKGE